MVRKQQHRTDKEVSQLENITPEKEQTLPDMLTPVDVQNYLRIGRTKTYDLLKQKPFPVLIIGSSLRIPRDSFLGWLAESKNVHI